MEIKCYNKNNIIPRIYFDLIEEVFKPCYETCLICSKKGNNTYHNCIECESGYRFMPEGFPKNNCVSDYPDYYSNIYKTEIIDKSNFIIAYSTEIIYNNDTYLNYLNNLNYVEYFNNIYISIDKDNILSNLRNEIRNNNLYIINILEKEKKDIIIKNDNIIYQITSTLNQNNKEYNNISNIILGECEIKLRNNYNISNNITLLILKIDIFEEGLLIPIIEYEIYNSKIKEKLNLNICKNDKIKIYIPVSINENNLFKYNSSDYYYNDICYSYTTENKTDITLKDRRIEYINNNLSLCENNCEYKGYDINNKKSICECFVKKNISLISEINNNKFKLLNNFIDIKNTININIIKCFIKVFNKEGFLKNIGNYIMIIIILLTFVLSILFKIKGYNNLKFKINEIIKSKSKNKKNPPKKRRKINILNTNNEITNTSSNKLKIRNYKVFNNIIKNDNQLFNKEISKKNKNKKKKEKKKNIIINYNDFEFNNLTYREALISDKRSYLQYYFSLLKTKHIIIFTFYNNSDYNSKIIKIILLLFSFSLFLTVNALFFNDSTMHKIYEDLGKFKFINHISNIFYSSIISTIITMILNFLSLTERDILKIKNEKNDKIKKATTILNYIFIKFIIFFILCYLFLFFFWFYLSCFCAVYKNTQIHLIKDTLISFGLSLLYPFIINLLPGIFRIPSLKNKDRECIYKISIFIQLII